MHLWYALRRQKGIGNKILNMKGNDLLNKQFGRLTVTKYIDTDVQGNHIWECQCKCGNLFQIRGVQLTRTNGAVTCKKCRVIDGKNDIPTFAPWMAEYFKNKEDILKYTYGSGKTVLVKCPDCGNEKFITVKDLYNHKSIGCICSDNMSYPEKFVISILKQLKIEFIYQYSPSWIKPLRYDFYIPLLNLIIEVDGGIGHGNRWTFDDVLTSEDLYQRDRYKDEEAIRHSIDIIRINAYPSDFNTLKLNCTDSLKFIFNMNNIDFDECNAYGTKNLVKEVCDKWNNGESIIKIANDTKLSKPTIRSYLKRGTELHWCRYNSNEEKKKRNEKDNIPIIVYKDSNILGVYKNCKEFAQYYNEIQNDIYINYKSLRNVIKTNHKYKGLKVEEYHV